MEEIRTRPLSALESVGWQVWLPQALVLVYLLLAMMAYLIVPFQASQWQDQPFIGGFVWQNMIINSMEPAQQETPWPALEAGLTSQHQLIAVQGKPVHSAADLHAVLTNYAPGDAVTLQARDPQGTVQDVSIHLIALPWGDRLAYFYLPYLIGLFYLGSAAWVFMLRRKYASGRAFALFSASAALSLGLLFDLATTHFFSSLWLLAVALTGGSAVTLTLFFPREARIVRGKPMLGVVSILFALLLAAVSISQLHNSANRLAYTNAWRLEMVFVGAALLVSLIFMLRNHRRLITNAERKQVTWLIWAAIFSFGPVTVWFILTFFLSLPFYPALLLPAALFPIVAGVTVQRYRLLQAEYLLSRGLQIGTMAVLVAVGYALLTAGLALLLGRFLAPDSPLFAGLVFFLLALAFNPIRERTQRRIDAVFFRGRRAYQDRLQTFSGELTRVVDLPGILSVLRRYVSETLAPAQMHIFVYDALSDQYVATQDDSGRLSSDLRFSVTSALVTCLSGQHTPLVLSDLEGLPGLLESDRPRLVLLGAQVFIPLPGRQRLSGWLALGPRSSGEAYSPQQIEFIESLCDQAALAIERAQVVANMEKRVREMNVLTRVAQGVNITLTLDDVLELVYAQTVQIIPADHFHIMLYDRDTEQYTYAFFLEKDDRVAGMENTPIPAGQALEQEVIQQGRPILTDDYQRECQRRGVRPLQSAALSWMGVPLNAGAESIGALSLGSTDPVVEYTAELQSLLQAIADQVAGAIVKMRLLQESQMRARQLTMLNEVTRQLTSTLEIEPLLQSILQNAVDMLSCEAGSLLLIDPQTDELVFRSVVGPVAADLLHQRMPADRGVVGKTVKSGEPVIVNDVAKYPDWFSAPDEQTGFITRAVMVVPLMVKDQVTGVIEVINKRDKTIFTRNDLDLLAAFASQAAVAMENARLYTLTDQALAARVEELSVMQRIDRELNASLDTNNALRITLEWAMRQSGATAGWVGVLHPDDVSGVQIMFSQGYTTELEPFQNELLPVEAYQLDEAITGGLPVRRSLNERADIKVLLETARSQALIPIRRETGTIGLIVLESDREVACEEDTMNFLVRLSDHASIAISNAQLYAAMQQANLAKSDFVSFVAHELKNPMTSVKGYTELISAGAVGPVTEVQASFLGTIRANIERMNTLVSDLNDMSKIEVGRLRLDFKAVSLSDALEEVIRSIRKQVEEKTQTLNVTIPEDLPQVWADRVRLVQVLVNLVSNAHKYTPAGGELQISAERCPNQWDPNGPAEVVHIWVKDNGIGISEEDQKKIFQKFFRSEDPKTREVTGTGLGLNITRSLVEMQGGKIWFESVFREGTTFHFTVPIAE